MMIGRIKNICIYFGCSILLFMSACGHKDKTDFSLKGTLANLDSPYIFIAFEKNDSISVDTIYADKKGSFLYKSEVEGLTMASLYFENKSWAVSIFLNKGWNIDIKGDVNRPDLISVNGGDVNNDLTAFKKNNEQLFNTRSELLSHIKDASSDEMIQNYSSELKTVNFELTNKAKQFIEDNPEKIASVILIQDFYKDETSIEVLDKQLALLQGEALKFPLTRDLKRYSEKVNLSQVGAKAPFFTLKNNNEEVTFDHYRNKYLLITFSESDSTNILSGELPQLIEAYKEFASRKNVEFLSVVMTDEIKVTPDSIKWTVVYEPNMWASEIIKSYNITEIPYNVLISPAGIILGRGLSVIPFIERIKEPQIINEVK